MNPDKVNITHPAMLIRINKVFHPGMSAYELYDATRGTWRVSERRDNARFAFAVHAGEILEVYEILKWHPAGTTAYTHRNPSPGRNPARWEFIGNVAPEVIREQYVGRSVAHYFQRGNANPIMYINC
jgi:hypothetical protein